MKMETMSKIDFETMSDYRIDKKHPYNDDGWTDWYKVDPDECWKAYRRDIDRMEEELEDLRDEKDRVSEWLKKAKEVAEAGMQEKYGEEIAEFEKRTKILKKQLDTLKANHNALVEEKRKEDESISGDAKAKYEQQYKAEIKVLVELKQQLEEVKKSIEEAKEELKTQEKEQKAKKDELKEREEQLHFQEKELAKREAQQKKEYRERITWITEQEIVLHQTQRDLEQKNAELTELASQLEVERSEIITRKKGKSTFGNDKRVVEF